MRRLLIRHRRWILFVFIAVALVVSAVLSRESWPIYVGIGLTLWVVLVSLILAVDGSLLCLLIRRNAGVDSGTNDLLFRFFANHHVQAPLAIGWDENESRTGRWTGSDEGTASVRWQMTGTAN